MGWSVIDSEEKLNTIISKATILIKMQRTLMTFHTMATLIEWQTDNSWTKSISGYWFWATGQLSQRSGIVDYCPGNW